MSNNFQGYSKYYDILYKDKNYAVETLYVLEALKESNKDMAEVLEYGSGTGNHAAYFSQHGINVTGLERSEEMVRLAKLKNIKGYVPLIADVVKYSLNKQFDAAIALFHVISYLTSNAELVECFLNTNKHLKMDGLFLFDVWYAPAVYEQKPLPRIKELEDEETSILRFAEPMWHVNRNVVDVNYKVVVFDKSTSTSQTFTEKHPMRFFSLPEVELLALLSGFAIVKAEEFLTKSVPTKDTWGVCFMLKKIKDV